MTAASTDSTESIDAHAALHRAVARYRVVISRRIPRVESVEVTVDLMYDEAREVECTWAARLGLEEALVAGRMCRSLALLQLTNGEEVARILGYGPDFSFERAAAAVAAIQGGADEAAFGVAGAVAGTVAQTAADL